MQKARGDIIGILEMYEGNGRVALFSVDYSIQLQVYVD